MKLKMLETYQAVDLPSPLLEGTEVDVPVKLGVWLLEHRKAQPVSAETPPHYGAQAEAQLRHDDELYAQMTKPPETVELIVEGEEFPPQEETPAEEPATTEAPVPAEEAPVEEPTPDEYPAVDEIMTTKPKRKRGK
jgi:hypothetical protein